jgi:ribonuclease P protein component
VADCRPTRARPRKHPAPPDGSFSRIPLATCRGDDHPFLVKGANNEANVPASQPQQTPHPWFPRSYADEGRARCPQESAPKGSLAPHGDGLQEVVVTGARPVGRFPPSQRVRKRLEFEAAQGNGRKAILPHFVLLLYARAAVGEARLGVVASRRIGSAVIRNRAKRLVREAFRATRQLWMPGIDVVVIVRRPLEGMKLEDVRSEWTSRAELVQKREREARRDLERRSIVDDARISG